MCEKYSGYTNYETWLVSLWIDNDQGLYNDVQELARENVDSEYDLANAIKDFIEEFNPLAENADMFSDLLQSALQNVNWQEIAENWIEAIKEEVK